MKKLLIFFPLILTFPVLAACPIDVTGGACSIADSIDFPNSSQGEGTIQPLKPLTGTGLPDIAKPKTGNFQPITQFQNENDAEKSGAENNHREFRQKSADFSYNASCQFGDCSQTGTPRLFQQRR